MTTPEARPEAVAVTEEMVEAMAEALFFAEKWTDHDCRWADIVAEEGTPTRAVVQHFREKATRVLSRFSPLAKKAASTSLWSILDEVREFFPPSDESVGFMPFEDWKLRASKAAAQVRSAQDHGGEANEMIGEPRSGRMAWHLKQAEARAAAASARAAKAVEVLRQCEWSPGSTWGPRCPMCGRYQSGNMNVDAELRDHSFGCSLATLLSDHPAPEPGVEAGEIGAAFCWAMDEIDKLSNRLCGFAYPQGMAMLGREDQHEAYVAAVHARRLALAQAQRAAPTEGEGNG